MKKIKTQFFIAFVCAFLGFLLAYQFKLLNLKTSKADTNQHMTTGEITSEIDSLKKQKEELEKQNNSMIEQIKQYEEAAKSDTTASELRKQLDTSRLILGMREVKGQGIELNINPKKDIELDALGNATARYITQIELLYLVNELNFAGAQAISINEQRITTQTGIRLTAGDSAILINDVRVSPKDKITIKAIGDANKLKACLDFAQTLDYGQLKYYNCAYSKKDEVVIPKYVKTFKYDSLQGVD